MKKISVYSIPNCDVTKLAFTWLKKNNIEFNFHDYKKEGISAAKLDDWSKQIPWETILNKRGTTWKKISLTIQQTITNQKNAIQLMQEYTSLIKRPVIEVNGSVLIGFDEEIYNNKILNK